MDGLMEGWIRWMDRYKDGREGWEWSHERMDGWRDRRIGG